MFTCGYIPDLLKQGVIITLHKGGRKSKKGPNNYRAITLLSAILKLFERILLKLLECNLTKPFSTLQGGGGGVQTDAERVLFVRQRES